MNKQSYVSWIGSCLSAGPSMPKYTAKKSRDVDNMLRECSAHKS
jgi:hypothetical protein